MADAGDGSERLSDRHARLRPISSGPAIDRRAARSHLAGAVAADLAVDLAAPLRAASDRLALSVDTIDRHIATTTGPVPYPWKSLNALRQELASSYMDATVAARRIDDLRGVLMTLDRAAAIEPVNAAIETGIHLAGHRLTDTIELVVDLGPVPPARLERGGLALIVARAVMLCAESAGGVTGSALSVRSAVDGADGADGADGGRVVVSISDNGRGTAGVMEAAGVMAAVVAEWDGLIDVAVTDGQGCAFELRLALT